MHTHKKQQLWPTANELIFWNLLNPSINQETLPHTFNGPTLIAAAGNGTVFQYIGLENKLYCWFWKTVKDLYKEPLKANSKLVCDLCLT